MARRRIRQEGRGGEGNPGRRWRRRRGWWNRKPPPRGSLVPRSTISRQHNSSPLVHSPQPSGTAETSTLILLAGSRFSPRYPPPYPPLVYSPCPHPVPSPSESARPPLLSSSCPNFIPRSPPHTSAPGFIQLHLRPARFVSIILFILEREALICLRGDRLVSIVLEDEHIMQGKRWYQRFQYKPIKLTRKLQES